jgi:hypothetical protein
VLTPFSNSKGKEGEGEERSRVTCVDGTVRSADRTEVKVLEDLNEVVKVWR